MDYNQMLIDSANVGDFDGAQSALKHGADVNSKGEYDSTALIWAAFWGHTAEVKMLINAGASLDIQDGNGNTALILVAYKGHTEIAQMLIDAGADLKIKNNDSKTALDFSLEKEHHDIAKLIKSHIEKQAERQEYAFDLNI